MLDAWNVPGLDSGVEPPEFAAGKPPPIPFPPDPPNPSSPLSPVNFLPLSSQNSTVPKCFQRQGSLASLAFVASANRNTSTTTAEPSFVSVNENEDLSRAAESVLPQNLATLSKTVKSLPVLNSTIDPSLVLETPSAASPSPSLTTLLPKQTSPILTNKSSSSTIPPSSNKASTDPSLPPLLPNPVHTHLPPPKPGPSLVEKIRVAEDKTLKRLAPASIS